MVPKEGEEHPRHYGIYLTESDWEVLKGKIAEIEASRKKFRKELAERPKETKPAEDTQNGDDANESMDN